MPLTKLSKPHHHESRKAIACTLNELLLLHHHRFNWNSSEGKSPQKWPADIKLFVFPPSKPSASTIPRWRPKTPALPSCPAFSVHFSLLLGLLQRTDLANNSFLACWASAGYNAVGCAAVETQLRKCMDGPKPPPVPPNTINYHLSRMQKYMTGPKKQK